MSRDVWRFMDGKINDCISKVTKNKTKQNRPRWSSWSSSSSSSSSRSSSKNYNQCTIYFGEFGKIIGRFYFILWIDSREKKERFEVTKKRKRNKKKKMHTISTRKTHISLLFWWVLILFRILQQQSYRSIYIHTHNSKRLFSLFWITIFLPFVVVECKRSLKWFVLKKLLRVFHFEVFSRLSVSWNIICHGLVCFHDSLLENALCRYHCSAFLFLVFW